MNYIFDFRRGMTHEAAVTRTGWSIILMYRLICSILCSHRPLVAADSDSDDEYGGVGFASRHESEVHLRPAQYTFDRASSETRGKPIESRFGQPPLPKYDAGSVNRSGRQRSV